MLRTDRRADIVARARAPGVRKLPLQTLSATWSSSVSRRQMEASGRQSVQAPQSRSDLSFFRKPVPEPDLWCDHF
ncbi:MAG: hypothetical protein QNJ29_08920 [Rhizobiaceae bacterium]|nr:hypothetical protein [Rhizobiaceae bacterium]